MRARLSSARKRTSVEHICPNLSTCSPRPAGPLIKAPERAPVAVAHNHNSRSLEPVAAISSLWSVARSRPLAGLCLDWLDADLEAAAAAQSGASSPWSTCRLDWFWPRAASNEQLTARCERSLRLRPSGDKLAPRRPLLPRPLPPPCHWLERRAQVSIRLPGKRRLGTGG